MILSERFHEALVYAAQLHARQMRKGSETPYLAHLLSVAAIVLEYGGSEAEAIAALLHDAVEDQGGQATRAEILRRYGSEVAEIVDGCTDADVMPKPPWKARKEEHIARVRKASAAVRRVIAADKLHNLRSQVADYRRLRADHWARFSGGRDGTLWYYQSMIDTLAAHGDFPELIVDLHGELATLRKLVAQYELGSA